MPPNGIFCGAECKKIDKRERVQAKRTRVARDGRCGTCGLRKDKVMKRPKTLWLNVERICAADGKMKTARIGVVTAMELDLVLQQIAATRAKLPVPLPVDETRKLRIVPAPEKPTKPPTRVAIAATPSSSPRAGLPKNISIAPRAKSSGKPGKGKG